MAITLASDFAVTVALPLDARLKAVDLTARDAIASGVRYEGMVVYVVSEATNFQLIGGVDNSNWEELSGGGGSYEGVQIATGLNPGSAIDLDAKLQKQMIKVSSVEPRAVLANLPFTCFTAEPNGELSDITHIIEILLVSTEVDNTVIIPYNNPDGGCIGNFGEGDDGLEISAKQFAKAIWEPVTKRFYVSRGA